MHGINIDILKKFGQYLGFHDEYGYVYGVGESKYGLKGGIITRIWEEIIL